MSESSGDLFDEDALPCPRLQPNKHLYAGEGELTRWHNPEIVALLRRAVREKVLKRIKWWNGSASDTAAGLPRLQDRTSAEKSWRFAAGTRPGFTDAAKRFPLMWQRRRFRAAARGAAVVCSRQGATGRRVVRASRVRG